MIFGFESFHLKYKEPTMPMSNNLDIPQTLPPDGRSHTYAMLQNFSKFSGKSKSIDELMETKENFIYILDMAYPMYYEDLHDYYLPERIHQAVREKRCRVAFCTFTEPYGTLYVKTMEIFADNHDIERDQLFLISGDNALPDTSRKFKTLYLNYFLSANWFLDDVKDKNEDKFNFTQIDYKLKNDFPYKAKFLCLNRITRAHRLYFFYRLNQLPDLFYNTLISLATKSHGNGLDFSMFNPVNDYTLPHERLLKDPEESLKVSNFFKNRRFNIFLDDYDKNINLASNIPYDLFNTTFISIITETDVSAGKVFISEKIAKGFYSKQPFILLGNPSTLVYLKRLGFKTFSKWIDESYDQEYDFKKRVNMIIKLMNDLNKYSHKELFKIRNEMSEVLEHNHNKIIKYNDMNRVFKKVNIYKKEDDKQVVNLV